MAAIINASTSSGLIQTADTSGTLALQSNGTTQFTVSSTGSYGQLKSGTAVASTSGTSIDFTGIPSWTKRITVIFLGVSTSITSNWLIQIGAGSFSTSSYSSGAHSTNNVDATSSAGFILSSAITASFTYNGSAVIMSPTTNAWVCSSLISPVSTSSASIGGGWTSLGSALDRVRITTVNGTDTFDAGIINILYEG